MTDDCQIKVYGIVMNWDLVDKHHYSPLWYKINYMGTVIILLVINKFIFFLIINKTTLIIIEDICSIFIYPVSL